MATVASSDRAGGLVDFTEWLVLVPEMDRRSMMMMTGFAALAAAMPLPAARADVAGVRGPLPSAPASDAGAYIFSDDFDGPAGSAPDPGKWTVQNWDDDVFPPVQAHY